MFPEDFFFCSKFSNHFQFENPECPLAKTAQERRHQRRVDQLCDSSNNSGVENARSVFQVISTPLPAATGRSLQFNVSSRSVRVEEANEKVS